MKNVASILASGALVFMFYIGPAFGQSIARVAKQERARQAKTPEPSRIYTNQDLDQFKAPAASQTTDLDKPATPDKGAASDKPVPAAETAKGPAQPEPAKKSNETAPVRDESYWRQQMAEARAKVQSLENKGDVLQLRLNDLNNKFQREQDVVQREAYQADIQKTLYEVDETRSKLEAARRDLEDLERQARRENVPPGWLR